MTIVADRAARPDVGPAGSTVGPRAGRPGSVLAIAGMVALVGGLALGSPALVLLGLVATVAAPLRDWLPLDLAIPSGALLLLVVAVFAGLAAGTAGGDLLAHPAALAVGYLVASGAVLLRRVRSASRPAGGVAPLPGGRHLVTWLPVAVALATGLLQAASLGVAKTWAFWGTDLARHMSVVARLQDHAALDYRAWPYPRGLELLAALSSVPGRPATPGLLLGYDLQLSAALTWFALALLAATGTSLAVRTALSLGLSGWTASLAGFLVGAGVLTTNTFVLSFVFLGAAPSLAAVAVLHGVPLLLLAQPARQHCAAVTARLASAVAVPRTVGPVAVAIVGGLLLLTNTFLEGFVDQAAAPGLVAVAAILTLLLAALVHPAACTRPVLVLAAAAVTVMLVAHLWQALVLVPATMVTCALLSVVTDLARYPHRLPHRHPGDGTAAVVVLVAAALAVPPLAQVATAGGTGLAGQTGSLGAEPWRLLVPGLLAALLLLPRMSRPWARTYVGGMVGLVAVLAVLLRGAGHGVDLEQWYPLKVCWFLTVFLAPWLALTVIRGVATGVRPAWRLLGRARGSAFVLRAAVLSVTAAAALVTWLPWQLGPTPDLVGAWQPYQGQAPGTQGVTRPLFTGGALDLAADNGSRFGTAVPVPFGVEQNFFLDQYSSLIVSKLFSFQNGRPDVAGATDVCDAVRRVAGSDPAVIVTRTDPVTVRRQMAADGCAGRARVVLLTRAY